MSADAYITYQRWCRGYVSIVRLPWKSEFLVSENGEPVISRTAAKAIELAGNTALQMVLSSKVRGYREEADGPRANPLDALFTKRGPDAESSDDAR